MRAIVSKGRFRPSDLPAPHASRPTENAAVLVGRPTDAQLSVPLGFQVKLFASGLDGPRLIRVAPNGDIFIAESLAGCIRVLRSSGGGDEMSRNEIFACGLKLPFGIAFSLVAMGLRGKRIPSCDSATAMAISTPTKRRKSSCRYYQTAEIIGPATLHSRLTIPKCSISVGSRPMTHEYI